MVFAGTQALGAQKPRAASLAIAALGVGFTIVEVEVPKAAAGGQERDEQTDRKRA